MWLHVGRAPLMTLLFLVIANYVKTLRRDYLEMHVCWGNPKVLQSNSTDRVTVMSVLPRGYECNCRPPPRYGSVKGEWSVYYKRPRCGQPRPQPYQRECACYRSSPSNAPLERPCCYDFPCKADCFNHGACTRPSGRYARTIWYPGECSPAVPPCQAFTCPNPPYQPCCYYTCNKLV